MIFTKLIYFVLSLNSTKNIYSKIIYNKNIKGCVESNVTSEIANRFNAIKGDCKSNFNCTLFKGDCKSNFNCTLFKGTYKIPYCCTVYGYEC